MRTPARAAAALLLLGASAIAEEPAPTKPAVVPSSTGVDVERLRRAAPFPTIQMRVEMSLDPEEMSRWAGLSKPSREALSKEQDELAARLKAEPGNLDAWMRLGQVRESLEDETGARETFRSAVSLSEGDEAPDVRDGERIRRRAEAVRRALEPWDGATIEKRVLPLLERACSLAPESAACHAELARARSQFALFRLLPKDTAPPKGSFSLGALLKGQPSDTVVAESLDLMGSALRSMERARDLKPGELEYLSGVFEMRTGCMILARRSMPPWGVMSYFSAFAGDLRRLHALRPDGVETLALAVLFETFDVALSSRSEEKGTKGAPPLDTMPDDKRKRLESDLAVLEKSAEESKGARRGFLLRAVAMFHSMLRADQAVAESVARLAAAAEPENDDNWKLVLATPPFESRLSDLPRTVSICEERLRSGESAQFRFVAAKCHYKLGNLDAAEKHLRAALKADPADYRAVMGLAALKLRGGGPGSAPEALEAMTPISEASTRFEGDDLACFVTIAGIAAGVDGRMEEAERLLGTVRKRFPKYVAAEEALRALGKSPDEPVK